MAYQVNKTDGTIVATVADSQIDTLSTDLTLIGKNYSGFGEALNENFIKLLENFSGTTIPIHPIKGQIWFDATENKLKVYSGTAFVPVSSATISNTQPSTLGVGDLWFNNSDKQLYFFDGINTILLGPSYSESQGVSGLVVSSILDTLNQTRVITSLFDNGVLLGIFSNSTFTPKNAIAGFSGNVGIGFTQGTLSGIKFDVTCTNSEKLGTVDATTYARRDTSNSFAGQVRVNTNLGIVFGAGDQGNLTVDSTGNVFFSNSASDKSMIFNVRKGIVQEQAIEISAATRTIGIYDSFSDSITNVGGDLNVGGDVTINGTLTINDGDILSQKVTELLVEDKTIVLAETGTSGTNSDAIADGGGIILRGSSGTRDHVWLWSDAGIAATSRNPALAAQSWTSSEDINIANGKTYRAGGAPVIEPSGVGDGNYKLGLLVTSIPGVTSFGAQTRVDIGSPSVQLRLENNRISTVASNDDVEIEPDGTGNVALIGSPKITGLADPTSAQDAATKEYVDDVAESRNIVLSMDLSDGRPNSYISGTILPAIAPPAEYRNGTVARILCTTVTNSTTSLNLNPLLNKTPGTFNTPSGTAPALTDVSISTATIAAPTVTTTRVVKTFSLTAGTWTFVTETALP